MIRLFSLALWVLAVGGLCQAAPPELRFDRDIRPLLSDKCFHCHGPDQANRAAGLRLDVKEEAVGADVAPFVPGDLDGSLAWERITSDDPELRMPPADAPKQLTEDEIARIGRWIETGADWTDHWAFRPVGSPPVPAPDGAGWGHNPIDAFVLQRMRAAGREPAPEADRRTLIRRLTLDLTGLPPTRQEVHNFLQDSSPHAYETLVDRLLASEGFGERMAVMWMDAARYGDTSVYHADGPRDMWAWRDAVVDAYNRNMPFDRFSIAQLAGDLLPAATLEEQILSGFNRNNGTTDEGGAIAEEYRVEYAVDRVRTTAMVWMGLTLECAQCHDHKFDPLSQVDYYRFFAFFNVSRDGGMQTRNGNAEPKLEIPDRNKSAELPEVESRLAEVQRQLQQRRKDGGEDQQQWLASLDAQDHSRLPVPANPLAHYPLDEQQDMRSPSSVANQSPAVLRGAVSRLDERGGAVHLDAGGQVDLGDVGNFLHTDAFSFGGWVRVGEAASGALLARMDSANKHRGYDILLEGGHVTTHFIHSWPDNALKVVSEKKLSPDQWHHVMVTYDGSRKAEGVTIYVDGEPWKWTIQEDRLRDTIQTPKSLLIGSRHGGGQLVGDVDDVRVFARRLTAAEVQTLADTNPLDEILAVPPDQRSDQHRQTLEDYFFANVDQPSSQLRAEQQTLQQRRSELKEPLTTVMVMGDMETPRETFVLTRGNYATPSETRVQPGVPTVLPQLSEDVPPNRLGLARWLFREDHPLTARVTVNRYWHLLFGQGLVTTLEDFGAQGDYPSHPELLDWLADDFRQHDWNIKRTLKQMVMSATYRQSAVASPADYLADPDNRLLARGPRFRLAGEFIRDSALALSGRLVDEAGGPGVKPYQPPGLWVQVGLSGKPAFVQDHGDALYRRSLYTYWKRSAPPPSMQIFDAPTREKCTLRRARTNTPLQALVTLNDVQFVEAARGFAARALRHEFSDASEFSNASEPSDASEFSDASGAYRQRLDWAFESATARLPSKEEREIMLGLLEDSRQHYRSDPAAAAELLQFGESPRDETLDEVEHAAWTTVTSMILNLDEVLTRP